MARERRIAALITGLVLVGCATQPPTGPAPDGRQDPPARAYGLKDAPDATRVEVAGVAASSTRNATWFPPAHAIDGKPSSAWGPAADDDQPTLTLDLGRTATVVGIGLKVSLGDAASPEQARVRVDVAAVAADGTATTILEGWAPPEASLTAIAVPATATGTLRFTFDTGGQAGLLVCEAQVLEGPAASPTPTPTTSPTPSASPTASPTASPSASPTPGLPIAAPDAAPGGRTFAEWNAAWWQWAWSQPDATHPLRQTGAVDLSAGQSGDVWFLGGGFDGGALTRTGTVPEGTALFFPILNRSYAEDARVARGELISPFPGDPLTYPLTQETFASLTTYLDEAGATTASALTLAIDGQAIGQAEVERYYNVSAIFEAPLLPGTLLAVGCAVDEPSEPIPGTGPINNCWRVDTSALLGQASGYYIYVPPLPAGEHTIRFTGTRDAFTLDVTYELTVTPAP